MKHHAQILLFLVSVFACSPKTDEELKPLFESILSSDLTSNRPVWVIAESDTASNRTMFGMDICTAEFFKRSLLGKNRMIFDGREAKMTIWDCLSTCLSEPKVFRFAEEYFPEVVDVISQSHLDSLQKVVDSKVLSDSVRREAFRMLKSRAIYRFSKPIFFDWGSFALINYSKASVEEGYMVWENKGETWVQVHKQVYIDFENYFIIPEFIL